MIKKKTDIKQLTGIFVEHGEQNSVKKKPYLVRKIYGEFRESDLAKKARGNFTNIYIIHV